MLLKAFTECRDERTVESLNVALRLWSISHASPLLRAFDLAQAFQQRRSEFSSIIRGQEAGRANQADEVLERFAHAFCVLVLQLIQLNETGEHVHKDEDVLKSTHGGGELQQVADEPIPDVLGFQRDSRHSVPWNRVAVLVADLAVGDKVFDVTID